MKQLNFIFLMLLLTLGSSAQLPELAGTWYVKHLSYQFPQDGTARVFTKHAVPGSSQKLVIDKSGNYYFYEYLMGKIDTAKGTVSIADGLIQFKRSLQDASWADQNFKLFLLLDSTLIYSNKIWKPFATKTAESSFIEPVEVPASYKWGQESLLSEIYKAIEHSATTNRDTAYLNVYTIVVDSTGKAYPETMERLSGEVDFTFELKRLTARKVDHFIPAKQNGRFVRSRIKITFTF